VDNIPEKQESMNISSFFCERKFKEIFLQYCVLNGCNIWNACDSVKT
jgi:hypothetical protein